MMIAIAVTSAALVGTGNAQDRERLPTDRLPIPIPDPEPKQAPEPPPSSATRITGKVKSVDGHLLTLADGVQLVFVPGLSQQHGELKPGAMIKASYAETAGRKVVTSIRVEPL